MKKIILFNIAAVIVLLLICESVCFIIGAEFQYQFIKTGSFKYLLERYTVNPTYQYYDIIRDKLRPVAQPDGNRKPVILFGCSVTYGNLLNDEENFSGVLAKLTKRPVYNMANDGWTFSHMLKQLKYNEDIKELNPEFIIYTYINDQRRRLYFFQGWPHDTELYFRYTLDKNGNLKEVQKKYPFYYRLLTVKYIQYLIQDKLIKDKKRTSDLMIKILRESSDIMKNRWPDAKLIMLLYDDIDCSAENHREIYSSEHYFTEEEKDLIEKMGFTVINAEECFGKVLCTPEYKVGDGHHPSAKMWEEFLPLLVNKLKM